MNKTGVELIAEERQRQIEKEGWTKEHDLQHVYDELAIAASCYALPEDERVMDFVNIYWEIPIKWPFDATWWKPTPNDRIRELVKAGALIAAEIDRLNSLK